MRQPMFGRGELRRVMNACRWVRATAAFLPLLKPFLIRRLADEPGLARKVWGLTGRQSFRLWERLKDSQAHAGRHRRKRPTRRIRRT